MITIYFIISLAVWAYFLKAKFFYNTAGGFVFSIISALMWPLGVFLMGLQIIFGK